MTIAIILGTRPEIIKMSPIVRECQRRGVDFFIIHTGQHYTYEMDKVFLEQLQLPKPQYSLDVGSGSHGEQTGKIMAGIEWVLMKHRPEMTLVQGDTNTVMAGALAAAKLHIGVGHVEAGLRSFDMTMPEEINRIVADHVSSRLFAPTAISRDNLLREGIEESRVHITGNTIVDAVLQNLEISRQRLDVIKDMGLKKKGYALVTAHRAENVDVRERLEGIARGLEYINRELGIPIIFPVHPRTDKMLKAFGIRMNGVRLIKPIGFLEFLQAEAGARLILTDSGGVQEEACILGVPCVTFRDNTERPETVDAGANRLTRPVPGDMLRAATQALCAGNGWKNPLGDGDAAVKIIERSV